MRQIEIDITVHKVIESARMSFQEPENDILKRLLGIDEASASNAKAPGQAAERKAEWSSGGVSLAHGTKLEMTYAGRRVHAVIDDGAILYEGERYKAPSPAAINAVISCGGPDAARNGWNDWCVIFGGTKRTLGSLRS